MTLNRKTHPLDDGEYPVLYITTDSGNNELVRGSMNVIGQRWMLVQTWNDYDDGHTAPAEWIELPVDCAYQQAPVAGKAGILLTQPIDIQSAKKNRKERPILSSPKKPPMS